jgi:hypothetical protein
LEVYDVKLFTGKSSRRALALIAAAAASLCVTLSAHANDLSIGVTPAKNSPPIAENLELTTFRGVAVDGSFRAVDPDGDVVTFEVVSVPKRGDVTMSDEGTFTYTPKDGAKGKDSFAYVAVDENGGVSPNATVSVSIKKQSTKTTYADMDGDSAQYAALVLAEKGVFTGETLGGEQFFRPDQAVTRGEFLAMCLDLAGVKTPEGVTRTGFYDDDEMPVWVKPYISAALIGGVINGYRNGDGRLVFSPQSPVTYSEAAVMLSKILNVTDAVSAASAEYDAVPAWAYTATVNLSACNVLPSGCVGAPDPVTRSAAAKMLLKSSELIETRGGSDGLLSWAR